MNRPVVVYPIQRFRAEAIMAIVCLGGGGIIGLIALYLGTR